MRYAVFADLSRHLASEERSALFEALDANVPDSGCVGSHRGRDDEAYFSVVVHSEEEANELARYYMDIVLQHAGIDVEYALTLQVHSRD